MPTEPAKDVPFKPGVQGVFLSVTRAKLMVTLIGLIAGGVDYVTPADLNDGIFYALGTVICIWTRSVRWMWGSTAVFIVLNYLGLILGAPPEGHPVRWEDWTNRSLTAGALILLAILGHLRIRNLALLEAGNAEIMRRHALQAASEARYRSLVQASSQIVWLSQPSGRQGDELGDWQAFTGQSDGETVGFGWVEAVHPDDRERSLKAWKKAISSGTVFEVEQRVRRYDGEYRLMQVRAVPVLDDAGKIREWVGMHTDITPAKQAEQALRSSEERMRLAFDAAKMGAWDWDISSGAVVWSGEHEHLFGLAPGSFGGTFEAFLACLHPEDRAAVRREFDECMKERKEYRAEYRCLWPDGSIHWITGRGRFLYSEDGRALRMVGVNVDVTNRKLAEDALIRSEKLASVGRLAATISHEINNPLEAVMNLLFLAASSPKLDKEVRTYLQAADSELRRISHIANRSLSFYRNNSTAEQVQIDKLLEDILGLYARRIKEAGITVNTCYRTPATIYGLGGELRQVFGNLITNAIDASPPGGLLHIHVTARRKIDWKTASVQEGVQVSVADAGPGIRPEHIAKLFQPFFTTKQNSGTGLGLWVSRGIVEKHGGAIRVRSSVKHGRTGTIFVIFLPGDCRSASLQEPGKTPDARAADARVS